MELKLSQRKKGQLNLPLVYLAVTGAGFFFFYILYQFKRLPKIPCVFKAITGWPCPTCGSTRVLVNLLKGKIIPAFLRNPLVFLGGIAFMAWFLYGFYMLFTGEKILVSLTKKETLFLEWTLAILFFLNWLYLVIAGV